MPRLKLSCSTSFLLLSPQNRNTSMFIKITPLHIVFSSLFSIFDMWWNTVSRLSHPQIREGMFHLLSHRRAFSFLFIAQPTQRWLDMGWNALFSFFYLQVPKWLLTLREIHRKCLVEDTISEWWFFFLQHENHIHAKCPKRMSVETGRFDTNSSCLTAQKFRSFKV